MQIKRQKTAIIKPKCTTHEQMNSTKKDHSIYVNRYKNNVRLFRLIKQLNGCDSVCAFTKNLIPQNK